MRALEAVVFDLYGTLLDLGRTVLHSEVPRLLHVRRRAWIDLVRSDLLTTSFPDARAFCEFVTQTLAPEGAGDLVEGCLALVERELASIKLHDGVLPMLHFLKRRGFKLGLASNVSSVHKDAIHTFGLAPLFDAVALSCEEGRVKPDPEVYNGLCRRLDVEPARALFVGDSVRNDVLVPLELGMHALRTGGEPGGDGMQEVWELGLRSLVGDAPPRPLLAVSDVVSLGDRALQVDEIRPISEGAQGRYNLVFRVEAHELGGGGREPRARTLFAKRYLTSPSAHVEALLYRLQGMAGLPTCDATTVGEDESLLVVSKAEGERFSGGVDRSIAREIGRHFAFGYVFSNADLRPRNAFLSFERGEPRMTMVDLELCLLNLAIDVDLLPDPSRPEAIDVLGREKLLGLVKRRVLTDRTLPRARNEFFDLRNVGRDVVDGFGEGFLATYDDLKSRAHELCAALEARLYQEPFLLIGTSSYRRSMARIDVEDIRGRILEEPQRVLEKLLGAGR